jgi:hypothetical protein
MNSKIRNRLFFRRIINTQCLAGGLARRVENQWQNAAGKPAG